MSRLLDGRVIVEQWVGALFGETMFGWSIRARLHASDAWRLVLFWTTSGDRAFAKMTGTLRHRRAEFFATNENMITRYTFSDIGDHTIRWDTATSTNGGDWRTDWIMEFTRTSRAVDDRNVFDHPWTPGILSPFDQAHLLDAFHGEWVGRDDHGRTIALSCAPISPDALVIDSLRVHPSGNDQPARQLWSVSGWINTTGEWQSWTADSGHPSLRPASLEHRAGRLRRATLDGLHRLTMTLDSDGLDVRLEHRADVGRDFSTTLQATLQRNRSARPSTLDT